MRVTTNNNNNNSNKKVRFSSSRRQISAVIPLKRPEAKPLVKGDYVVLKCRTIPGDASSQTYDLPIPYFRTGTPEEYLKWRNNVKKGMAGYGATTGPQKYSFTRRLLEGDALAAFELKATELATETAPHYNEVMEALTKHVFPNKALQKQKRYMRRVLRKPRELSTRDFVSRVCEINNLLTQFPGATNESKLPDDELLDLLEFGMPNSWQRSMTLQDFDPVDHSIQEFVSFCERLEATDPEEVIPKRDQNNDSNSSNNKKRKNNSGSSGSKSCLLHGEDCGHSSHECRTLKAQAAKLKEKYKDSSSSTKQATAMFQEAMVAMMGKHLKKAKKGKSVDKELKEFENMNVESEGEEGEVENPFAPSEDESDDSAE